MSIDWIFGEYKILRKIATGGMAEVFLAKRVGVKGFEKLLAIKRILPQFSENEDFISMFIDEAKLAAQLNHRNIVQIYDFGNQQGSYYIAMEYVFGKDLRTILKKSRDRQKRLPLTQCAYIITEAARGLEYAHNMKDHYGNPLNIIHRDISPQNIFISYEGDVKLADFGIAKAASKSTETRAGVLKGKILYMSPEQAWGKLIDKRSDLYSLGVVLYEMVADRKIFDADSEFSMLEKVRNAQVEFPPETFEKVPRRLFRILKKVLEKSPEDRYQTAHEMHVDLENYLLSAKETLSEKMISNYLRDLFSEEIEEERKILIEGGEVPVEKTISVEPLAKTEAQEPGKIPKPYVGLERIEPLKKERIFTFVREALQRSDVRMGVGVILILLILGVVISSYLLKEKTPTTIVTTTPSERRETSSPAIAPAPPKPDAKTTPSVPAQELSVPKTEKEASVKEREPKTSTPLTDLISHGPQLLQENRHIEVLEQIDKLSDKERQNINVKVLESFAYLRKWIYQKDKISKTHWGNLYKVLESSGDRGATRLLMRIAKDPEEWTRLYAVSLLGSIGDQRALKDLQRISDSDPNWRIRRNARKAISLIQNRP